MCLSHRCFKSGSANPGTELPLNFLLHEIQALPCGLSHSSRVLITEKAFASNGLHTRSKSASDWGCPRTLVPTSQTCGQNEMWNFLRGQKNGQSSIKPNWKQQLLNLNLQHNQPPGYLIITKLDWQYISYVLVKITERRSCICNLVFLLLPPGIGGENCVACNVGDLSLSPVYAVNGCVTWSKHLRPSDHLCLLL